MKRIVLVCSVALWVVGAGVFPARALVRPGHAPLPDLDVRTAGRAQPELPEAALGDLRVRVPALQAGTDKVLGGVSFFSSRSGFLTGPGGAGLGVRPAFLGMYAAGDRHRVIKAFLTEHAGVIGYGAEVLEDALVTRDYVTAHNGLRTTVWQQQVDGIPVWGTVLMGHVTRRGELVNLTTLFVPRARDAAEAGARNRAALVAAPPVGAGQAVAVAAANLGVAGFRAADLAPVGMAEGADQRQKFTARAPLWGEVDARLVWVPMNSAVLRLAWQVILVTDEHKEMYQVLVDAEDGTVLVRRSLNRYLTDATYRVYPSDSPSPFTPGWPTPNTGQPQAGQRSLFTLAAMDTNASPLGWINDADNETQGNNALVSSDLNGDGFLDPYPQGNPTRVFDFPMDLTQHPTNYTSASIVQLFFVLNRYHDFLYGLGFTEAAGNFQADNFGRGGLGGDPVLGAIQVRGMYNNAFMQTPPDGVRPTLISLLFSGPTPMRDSALDAEVMLHEYTHGLTERTLGGGVGVNYFGQSGAIHEGNSDWFAMTVLSEAGDDLGGVYPAGGYLTYDIIPGFRENYYFGIRRYPYSTNLLKNPLTYKDIDPTQASAHPGIPTSPLFAGSPADEVHNAGEVWCIALWEMRVNLVAKHGWTNGNRLALQLVYDGMRLSVPNPNFLQLRDAILQADLVGSGGANHPEIWAAFAKRGMGGSATSPSSDTCIGVFEAFDLPGVAYTSTLVDDRVAGNGNGAIDVDECIDLHIMLRNGTQGVVSNLTATLFTTNAQVLVTEDFSAYPVLEAGEAGLNLSPYRIYTRPTLACGSTINFGIRIRTSPVDVRTNYFSLRTGFLGLNVARYTNTVVTVIPDNNTNGASSAVAVSGFMDPVGKVVVSAHVVHPRVADLTLELIGPDGTRVRLAQNRGGSGANFGTGCALAQSTTFDDTAPNAIGAALAPFVGVFRPEEPLSAFGGKGGTNVNGLWRLRAVDSQLVGCRMIASGCRNDDPAVFASTRASDVALSSAASLV